MFYGATAMFKYDNTIRPEEHSFKNENIYSVEKKKCVLALEYQGLKAKHNLPVFLRPAYAPYLISILVFPSSLR